MAKSEKTETKCAVLREPQEAQKRENGLMHPATMRRHREMMGVEAVAKGCGKRGR